MINRHLPKGWLLFPFRSKDHFLFIDKNLPCPCIWFMYWLITWDYDDWKSEERKVILSSVRISFMPD